MRANRPGSIRREARKRGRQRFTTLTAGSNLFRVRLLDAGRSVGGRGALFVRAFAPNRAHGLADRGLENIRGRMVDGLLTRYLLPQADDDGLLDVVGEECGIPATSLSNRVTNQAAVLPDDCLNGGLVGTDITDILSRDGARFIHGKTSP